MPTSSQRQSTPRTPATKLFSKPTDLPPTAQSPILNQDPRELFLTCAMRHSEGGAGSQTAAEFVSAGERSNKNSDMAPARSLPGLHVPLSPSLSVASQHRDSCAPEGLDLVLLLHDSTRCRLGTRLGTWAVLNKDAHGQAAVGPTASGISANGSSSCPY